MLRFSFFFRRCYGKAFAKFCSHTQATLWELPAKLMTIMPDTFGQSTRQNHTQPRPQTEINY